MQGRGRLSLRRTGGFSVNATRGGVLGQTTGRPLSEASTQQERQVQPCFRKRPRTSRGGSRSSGRERSPHAGRRSRGKPSRCAPRPDARCCSYFPSPLHWQRSSVAATQTCCYGRGGWHTPGWCFSILGPYRKLRRAVLNPRLTCGMQSRLAPVAHVSEGRPVPVSVTSRPGRRVWPP